MNKCPRELLLSEDYLAYIQNNPSLTWEPDYDYFVKLIAHLVDGILLVLN